MIALLAPIVALLIAALAGLATDPDRTDSAREATRAAIAQALGRPPAEADLGIGRRLPDFAIKERLVAWERLAAMRGCFALTWIPPMGFLFLAVGSLAFAGRTRIARLEKVPSPALAHLAKKGFAVCLGATVLSIGLPTTIPLIAVPAFAFLAIALFGLYLSNLPDRL
jgi:hypothetical protein